jgi:Rps23 Pro-64 3,4-dihydroxylase Tpa1-like proline 4-hydroxylase
MFGRRALRLVLHWHYTPNGCSVSPHCDARRKLGSHIFYFNTAKDWQPDWGGETLILEDNGRFVADSAPKFEDFDRIMPAKAIGNSSLLFMRREQSWHGVKEIRCPPDALRKVFIVVIEDWDLKARVRSLFRAKKKGY